MSTDKKKKNRKKKEAETQNGKSYTGNVIKLADYRPMNEVELEFVKIPLTELNRIMIHDPVPHNRVVAAREYNELQDRLAKHESLSQ